MAAKVLLLWLFALASGIVNACVIAPGLHAAATKAAMAGTSTMASMPGADMAGCPDCPDDDSGASPTSACAKFCVDGSSSSPTAQQVFDPWPALGIAVVPTMALSVVDTQPRAAARPDSAPPPLARASIPIAYLRLTL
jgi:hypothetical protein